MLTQASLSNVFLSFFPFSHATKTIFRHHVDHKHSIDADVGNCFRFFHSPCHVWSSITIFYGLFDAQLQFLTMKIDCKWDMWECLDSLREKNKWKEFSCNFKAKLCILLTKILSKIILKLKFLFRVINFSSQNPSFTSLTFKWNSQLSISKLLEENFQFSSLPHYFNEFLALKHRKLPSFTISFVYQVANWM